MPAKTKCSCGCGQAPAATTRLRKASCGCGASIMRVSRAALSLVDATCLQCGGPLSADCLFDRTCSHDEQDALDAIAKLEYRDMDSKRRSDQARNRRSQMRCANEACKSFVAHASNCDPTAPAQPCAKCGSTEPARYYPRHTVLRAAAAAAEMPF